MLTHAGWVLEVPGSFAEVRTEDELWVGGAGRTITLAATATGTPTGPMSAQDFLDQVAGDLGSKALTHRAGPLLGRARLMTDSSSGVEIGVVEGFMAVRGSGPSSGSPTTRKTGTGRSTRGGRSSRAESLVCHHLLKADP